MAKTAKKSAPANAGAGKGDSLLQEFFVESLQDILPALVKGIEQEALSVCSTPFLVCATSMLLPDAAISATKNIGIRRIKRMDERLTAHRRRTVSVRLTSNEKAR